jgi:TfoX/Sxy family transcriptional regulator of competence genes
MKIFVMVYNEDLANRIRNIIAFNEKITEKKMFGGLTFLYNNHMFCGIVKEELMLRVGPHYYEEALSKEFTREMDFTGPGRSMRGLIYISQDGIEEDSLLQIWIDKCLDFVKSLPDKPEKKKKEKQQVKKKFV